MTITVDTNVLVRVIVNDDAEQAASARKSLSSATKIRIASVAFCELVWVLGGTYRFGSEAIATVIRQLLAAENVVTHRSTAQTGLRFLAAGADFADGVIAHEGGYSGQSTFTTFDRKALRAALRCGYSAQRP